MLELTLVFTAGAIGGLIIFLIVAFCLYLIVCWISEFIDFLLDK